MEYPDNNKSAWNEPFYQERTIGKCISIGLSLISNRFLKIMKLAVPVILFSAVCFTIITYLFCDAGLELTFTDTILFKIISILISIICCAFLAAFSYRCVHINIEGLNVYSIGYKYMYNLKFWKNTIAAAVVFVFVALIAVALNLLANLVVDFFTDDNLLYQEQKGISIVGLIVFSISAVIAIIFLLPLYMALNVMMIEDIGLLKGLKKGYLLGWKKWGRIFAMDVIINVIIAVLAVFILSPAYVISLMQHSATLSRLQGDAVDIPAFFSLLTMGVLFLSSIFIAIIIITKFLPHAFFYANVACEDKEDEKIVNK